MSIDVTELTGPELSYWFLIAIGEHAYIDDRNDVLDNNEYETNIIGIPSEYKT